MDSWRDPRPKAKSTIYRFSYPEQDHKFDVGDQPIDPATGSSAGTVVAIDDNGCTIELRKGTNQPRPEATSLVLREIVGTSEQQDSLKKLAEHVIEEGIDAPGERRGARDLLLRRPPRLHSRSGSPLIQEGEDPRDAAARLVQALDESYLAIQGPPGSGKSTLGAELIVDLVCAGKRVGVTANSHKVIGELLDKVAAKAREMHATLRIGQRTNEAENCCDSARHLANNAAALDALTSGDLDVVGGTTWLWSRADMAEVVDVLFLDEAGQMSLANSIAAARCARNLVLLGDPQQLDQPLQGVHPPGADRSALAHILGDASVIRPDLGLFLDGTYRLHPDICAYTSEVFYSSQLHAGPGRERQAIHGVEPLSGSGLRFLNVEHAGCSNASAEEAAVIARHINELFASNATWTDHEGTTRPLGPFDIRIITPYNAQVATLKAHLLPELYPYIGTVDKFQGQQAPLAIYSMATSSPEDAPRGMEFLYSLNRLNVATSRARCLAVLVASPRLLHARCRTPHQMRLANALARFVENASNASM